MLIPPCTKRIPGTLALLAIAASFANSTSAQIEVSPVRAASRPVLIRVERPLKPQVISPYLFSSFLEPIGHSTYGGLWAQILVNPSFEEGLWSAENLTNELNAHSELRDASSLGLPAPWQPLDPAQGARYAPIRGDAANSNQSVLLMSLPGKEVGLLQQVYLPTHRELSYHGTVWLKHTEGNTTVRVTLRRHARPQDILADETLTAASNTWTAYSVQLTLQSNALAPLEPADFVVSLQGESRFLVDNVSLFPDDAVDNFDPEVLALARDLRSPLVRFGGNFTSAYNWRDGIGPKDKRVSMLNLAWGIPEYNTFGTDEFLNFCKLVHAQPQIALNLGTADPSDEADWVRYVDAHWDNGRGGLTWELGNELWGSYQVGYPDPSQAAARTVEVSNAVRAVDPDAKLIATGGDAGLFHDWNAQLLKTTPETFEYLSSHFIFGETVQLPHATDDFRTMAMLAAPWGLSDRIAAIRHEAVENHRPDLKLAFTEWLMITNAYTVPNYSNLGGALFAGGFLNTMMRNADAVAIADMTGNIEFGGIWKKREQVYASPAYWVLRTYAQAKPQLLLDVHNDSPTYSVANGITQMPDVHNVPYLDVVAAQSADSTKLLLFCVNRDPSRSTRSSIDLSSFGLFPGPSTITTITGNGLLDENNEYTPERITAVPRTQLLGSRFAYTFPNASVTVFEIPLRQH